MFVSSISYWCMPRLEADTVGIRLIILPALAIVSVIRIQSRVIKFTPNKQLIIYCIYWFFCIYQVKLFFVTRADKYQEIFRMSLISNQEYYSRLRSSEGFSSYSATSSTPRFQRGSRWSSSLFIRFLPCILSSLICDAGSL